MVGVEGGGGRDMGGRGGEELPCLSVLVESITGNRHCHIIFPDCCDSARLLPDFSGGQGLQTLPQGVSHFPHLHLLSLLAGEYGFTFRQHNVPGPSMGVCAEPFPLHQFTEVTD